MNTGPSLSRRPPGYALLWLLVLALVALNGVLIYGLVVARAQAAQAAAEAARVVALVGASSIDYSLAVNEDLRVTGSVPFETTVTVPINTTLPVDTVVAVPVEVPLIGVRTLEVPIHTTIPVRLSVDVPIDVEVPVDLNVPVNLRVPVHIALGETEFGAALIEAEALLKDVTVRLGGE